VRNHKPMPLKCAMLKQMPHEGKLTWNLMRNMLSTHLVIYFSLNEVVYEVCKVKALSV